MTLDKSKRVELIESVVDCILDNLSTKDMMRIIEEQLVENYNNYNDDELITEIEEYYPHLLD